MLITIGVLVVLTASLINGASVKSIDSIITAIIGAWAICAIAAFGSFGPGLFVILIWPIAFPAFLIFGLATSAQQRTSRTLTPINSEGGGTIPPVQPSVF